MLRGQCKVIVQTRWDGRRVDALIALHARRSSDSIEELRAKQPDRRIAVVLTGTDLYRDLAEGNPQAIRSLDLADRIVVLQDEALRSLARAWRRKAEVILQSAAAMPRRAKPRGGVEAIAVGHLREVKDPLTIFRAFSNLPRELPIRLRHMGAPLDASLAAQARALQEEDPRYRYLGARPHATVRRAIAAAHVLIHPSILEGGANVIVEAITAGTPVLASRMPGNVGMLGTDYPGYFKVGDDKALARLLRRCLDDPRFLARLDAHCRARRSLFSPAVEARAVRKLVRDLTL
jgi:putative glycosyltransferase (TIGR04348 family)